MGDERPLQSSLFDPPISRRKDPSTSKSAEQKYNLSARATRQRQVLRLVQKYPDKTTGELARIFVHAYPRLPIQAAAATPEKRISDLLRKGFVERFRKRICQDSGYECWTFVITQAGGKVLL